MIKLEKTQDWNCRNTGLSYFNWNHAATKANRRKFEAKTSLTVDYIFTLHIKKENVSKFIISFIYTPTIKPV